MFLCVFSFASWHLTFLDVHKEYDLFPVHPNGISMQMSKTRLPPPVHKHFLANMLVTKEPLGQLTASGIVKTLHAAENQNKQGRNFTRGYSFYATISFLRFTWVLLSSAPLFSRLFLKALINARIDDEQGWLQQTKWTVIEIRCQYITSNFWDFLY